jgi:hypothetical protein
VFTEFMEQRAPGHTTLDGKFYSKGLLGFKQDIDEALAALDVTSDTEAVAKREELEAMLVACDAVIGFADGTPRRPSHGRSMRSDQAARPNC